MFSGRTRWNTRDNPLADAYRKKKESGEPLINLAQSNPTAVGLRYPDGILAAFQNERNLIYRPDPRGLIEAREALQGYYRDHGVSVHPDKLFLTAGTSEAYSFLFKLLCDPGDTVLIPRPGYPLFDYLAALDSVSLSPYRLEYDHRNGWRLDKESILSAARENTRAILLIHPNNPTSSYVRKDEAEWLVRLCAEKGWALIADEVFLDFAVDAPGEAAGSFAGTSGALCFTLSGLSKIMGLPQIKLGWMVISGPTALADTAAERMELITDSFLSVNIPAQNALPGILQHRSSFQSGLIRRLRDNAGMLDRIFAGSPIRVLRVEGGWAAVLELPRVISEEDWALELLRSENVHVYPGYFFEFEREAYLTVSLIVPGQDLEEGARRILRVYEKHKG